MSDDLAQTGKRSSNAGRRPKRRLITAVIKGALTKARVLPRMPSVDTPPDRTLNAEVHRICMVEGGYADAWPRHLRCPCCGTGELRGLFTKHDFNHDQCINCGFVCVNPYPPEAILRKLYAGTYYTNFREFYEAKHLREVGGRSITAAPPDVLEAAITRATNGRGAGSWLEVGGGLGTVADFVRQRCPRWQVTLNDFNPRSLELARQIYGLDTVVANAEQLRGLGRRFDVISAISVLEHTTDPAAFLREYAQLLKPAGVLVVIVPQFTHLNAAVSKAASPNAVPPFHASLFREQNLRLLFERVAEFDAVETWQSGPPAFSLLHHYDFSDYWDISIPSPEEPVPRSIRLRDYPIEMAAGLNALGQAEPAVLEYFAKCDGRLYLTALATKRTSQRPWNRPTKQHPQQPPTEEMPQVTVRHNIEPAATEAAVDRNRPPPLLKD